VLEDGWKVPAEVNLSNPSIPLKANTFMASKARLDDIPRMMKVKEIEGAERYTGSTYSTREREKMLGLPKGYVEDAVNELYAQLTQAMMVEFEAEATWKNKLNKKYHHFTSRKYKFISKTEAPFMEIKMSTWSTNKNEDFLTCEQYSKRLLGNGWSIPVIEHLLFPLQQIFPKREYADYNYVFPWAPYNCI